MNKTILHIIKNFMPPEVCPHSTNMFNYYILQFGIMDNPYSKMNKETKEKVQKKINEIMEVENL